MMKILKRLWTDEEGQGMVEYALIIGLVAVVLILVIGEMTGGISNVFTKIKNKLTEVAPSPT